MTLGAGLLIRHYTSSFRLSSLACDCRSGLAATGFGRDALDGPLRRDRDTTDKSFRSSVTIISFLD